MFPGKVILQLFVPFISSSESSTETCFKVSEKLEIACCNCVADALKLKSFDDINPGPLYMYIWKLPNKLKPSAICVEIIETLGLGGFLEKEILISATVCTMCQFYTLSLIHNAMHHMQNDICSSTTKWCSKWRLRAEIDLLSVGK